MSVIIGNMVVALWESVREQIPEKKREDIAAAMLEVLLDHNMIEDAKDLEEARGSDTYLDVAIDLIMEEYILDEDDGLEEMDEE